VIFYMMSHFDKSLCKICTEVFDNEVFCMFVNYVAEAHIPYFCYIFRMKDSC
jgi:hypothetical protein